MKYFVIKPSIDKKIIGHYPQVNKVKHNCHIWDEPKFIEHVRFEKVEFEPITSNAILFNSSKVTDLIHSVSSGFGSRLLVSGKLMKILREHRKTGLQFFNSPVIYKDDLIQDYWILNTYEINMDFIDFQNSDLFVTKNILNKDSDSEVKIKSSEDYFLLKKEIEKKG